MLRRERGVKWLDTERGRVALESFGAHEREGPESPNVAVVDRPAVVKRELYRGVFTLSVGQIPIVNQQRTSEAGLHDETIASGEIQYDELRATPTTRDLGSCDSSAELARRYLAEHIGPGDMNCRDSRAAHFSMKIARDRFGLRELRHGVPRPGLSLSSRYRRGTASRRRTLVRQSRGCIAVPHRRSR